MPNMFARKKGEKGRTEIRLKIWPDEVAWEAHKEAGYFCAPRTLPLILRALRDKRVSGNMDPSGVYLELLANHLGNGVVELGVDDDHGYAAGYSSTKARKAWRERLEILEKHGFVRLSLAGSRIRHVLIVHPTVAMHKLLSAGLIDEELWKAYWLRQQECGQRKIEDLAPIENSSAASRSVKATLVSR